MSESGSGMMDKLSGLFSGKGGSSAIWGAVLGLAVTLLLGGGIETAGVLMGLGAVSGLVSAHGGFSGAISGVKDFFGGLFGKHKDAPEMAQETPQRLPQPDGPASSFNVSPDPTPSQNQGRGAAIGS